ncbi:MAG TPA: DUF3105 domain-containing protein [Jatrophihabitans sp.]|jgi:hypothetical protein
MAQRKLPSPPSKKAAGKPGARSTAPSGAKSGPNRPASARGPAGRPPTGKPGKSIVNQRQTPWSLIATVAVLVLFAGAIVAYAVTRHKDSPQNPYRYPETAAAAKIQGIIHHVEPQHTHVLGTVKYDMNPPIGGNHSQFWASCNGVTYTHQLANENAVHMLEHGAVWIAYNPQTLNPSDVQYLKTHFVDGIDRMAMTPYKGLKTPISLQAWGYQLFVQSAKDPRISQFIDAVRFKPNTVTPEPSASCSDPAFKADQSSPGHPFNG